MLPRSPNEAGAWCWHRRRWGGGCRGKMASAEKQSFGIRGSCHLSRTLLFPRGARAGRRAWPARGGPQGAQGASALGSYGERSSGNRGRALAFARSGGSLSGPLRTGFGLFGAREPGHDWQGVGCFRASGAAHPEPALRFTFEWRSDPLATRICMSKTARRRINKHPARNSFVDRPAARKEPPGGAFRGQPT